jgi:hypothetical protein
MSYYPGKYIITFPVEVSVSLDELQRRQAMRALNKYFVGKEQIPLDEKVPAVLQDASYRVCSTLRTHVTVGITYDGQIEVISHD